VTAAPRQLGLLARRRQAVKRGDGAMPVDVDGLAELRFFGG
jgi:hypothetical protein